MKFAKTFFCAALVCASANAVENGIDYAIAPGASPPPAKDAQIKVTEYFNFSCPACNASQPHVEEWIEEPREGVLWTRTPVPFQRWNGLYARAYYVLEAFKREDLVEEMFRAIHVERELLNSKSRIVDWLVENHGFDEEKTEKAFDSFGVETKYRKGERVIERFGVSSTPTFVVADRYVVLNKSGATFEDLFDTITVLVERVRAGEAD